MGGQWKVLPAFLKFSYIFTWITYYKYLDLDFLLELLTEDHATDGNLKQYLHSNLRMLEGSYAAGSVMFSGTL